MPQPVHPNLTAEMLEDRTTPTVSFGGGQTFYYGSNSGAHSPSATSTATANPTSLSEATSPA